MCVCVCFQTVHHERERERERERLGVRLKYFTYYLLYKFFSVEERFRFSDPLWFFICWGNVGEFYGPVNVCL